MFKKLNLTHVGLSMDDKSMDLPAVVHVTVDAVVVTVDAVTVDGVDVVAANVVVVCCSITVSANSVAATGFRTVSLLVHVIPTHVNNKCKTVPNKGTQRGQPPPPLPPVGHI